MHFFVERVTFPNNVLCQTLKRSRTISALIIKLKFVFCETLRNVATLIGKSQRFVLLRASNWQFCLQSSRFCRQCMIVALVEKTFFTPTLQFGNAAITCIERTTKL